MSDGRCIPQSFTAPPNERLHFDYGTALRCTNRVTVGSGILQSMRQTVKTTVTRYEEFITFSEDQL